VNSLAHLHKGAKPQTTLVNDRLLDSAALVTMLVYEGKTASEIAKALNTSAASIKREIAKTKIQELIAKEQTKRSMLIAHIPIASYSNRLRRLEENYQAAEHDQNHEIMLKCLAQAREETRLMHVEETGDSMQNTGPQIVVNIDKYESADKLEAAVEVATDGLGTP
jgi:predicted transcriptional regulator